MPEPPAAATDKNLFFRLFPSIMAPMFIAVLDQTIVATALPSISSEFGDVERLSWIVVAYLVANTIAAPVYGRLGDAYGRGRILLFALGLMLAGSLCCALAPSLPALIGARIIQGLGGGGLMTLSQSLIGETIPPRERARYQGYLSAVVVTSNSFGPVAGAWLTQAFGWRAIFLINIPLGLLALALARRLPLARREGAVMQNDFGGLIYFIGFIAPALIAIEQARKLDPALIPLGVGLAGAAALSLALLLRHEKRQSDPLLPLALLANPTIWRSDLMAACHGAALVSFINYTPLYLRAVRGLSISQTGYFLLPIALGIGVGSLTTGRLVSRTGLTAIFPSLALVPATALLTSLALFHETLPLWSLPVLFGAMSFFFGSVMGVVQVTVQNAAGAARLGSAAGSVQFSRAVGASIGAASVGAVLFAAYSLADPQARALFGPLLERGPAALDGLSADARLAAIDALKVSFRAAYLTIAGFAGLALLCAWTIPTRRL